MKLNHFQPPAIRLFALSLLLFSVASLAAQVPQGIPTENVKVDLSTWADRILYIGLPLIIIILFLIGRMGRRKAKEEV